MDCPEQRPHDTGEHFGTGATPRRFFTGAEADGGRYSVRTGDLGEALIAGELIPQLAELVDGSGGAQFTAQLGSQTQSDRLQAQERKLAVVTGVVQVTRKGSV